MKPNAIPCGYQPSRVVLIDDNLNFLNSLFSVLSITMNPIAYRYPLEALRFLNEEYKPTISEGTCFRYPKEQESSFTSLSIYIKDIHKSMYQPLRFNDISVVVVDYDMPGIDGLSLCRSIKNKNIKKILLTGQVDNEGGIAALNDGTIDGFVLKHDPDLGETLNKMITQLQYEYYLSLSNGITRAISAEKDISFLSDPAFVDLFYKIYKENKIVEYYLVDEHGAFLMFDINANPLWFIVKDEEEMISQYTFAKTGKAPNKIMKELELRRKLPFFYSEEDQHILLEDWNTYLHPATLLEGEKNYYYSIVKNSNLYQINRPLITAYQSVMDDYKKDDRIFAQQR